MFIDEEPGDNNLSLVRTIQSLNCLIEFEVDLEEYIWDSSSYEKENGMGPDFVHSFDTEYSWRCPYCDSILRISGWIREYPIGAYDSEDIDIQAIEDDDEQADVLLETALVNRVY